MNILALDCASKTGWATLINGQKESGVQDFSKKRGESNGMLFLKFTTWLHRMKEMSPDGFDLIVYEQAHHRGGAATEICVGLTTRAQEFAASIDAECMPVRTSTLKKATTGNGRAGKQEMIDWFGERFGTEPEDDNEADAMALLEYAIEEVGQC